MARESDYDVLIVGAGPVGMIAAICLSERGVRVKIIDEEWCPAARSYACALHPSSLAVLHRHGIHDQIIRAGRKIPTVAFYDSHTRRAEVKLSELPAAFPYLVVLAQSDLERLLEQRLAERAGVHVEWNSRLSRLQSNGTTVTAVIDQLVETGKGYSIPSLDWGIKRTVQVKASFVVGADGHNSVVRQALGIPYQLCHQPEQFSVFEFESDRELSDEVRVVFHQNTTSVCWPLSDQRCRWSFQQRQAEGMPDPRLKDRADLWVIGSEFDDGARHELERLLEERAQWFDADVRQITWSIEVPFEYRLVQHFGSNHCWLVGDAAHQTGPVGVQSLNVGLLEAEELAEILARILQENAPATLLDRFERSHIEEWQQLLGVSRGLVWSSRTPSWIKNCSGQLLRCVPASGNDLRQLVHQLDLELPAQAA